MSSSKEDETPGITPQVVHLIDLLKWANEGRLRVPKFQRDFVWRRQDIVDLFDSIAKHYPIGTLFLWGSEPRPETTRRIGPLVLPAYQKQGATWMVLDGQQRLTSLVGVLLRGTDQWEVDPEDEDPGRWEVFFDAREEGGFIHNELGEAQELPPYYIPAPSLLDAKSLFRQTERIMAAVRAPKKEEILFSPFSELDAEGWLDRAQDVARAIQGYRIPIVQFTTNDLTVAVESFSRLNNGGRDIGQDEMFSALTYSEGEDDEGARFHLAAEIDQLQKAMIQDGFGAVDRTILLRAVLTAAKLDMYRTDWSRLGERVKAGVREALPEAVREAAEGLKAARRFLSEDLGVANARMLPYSMQLVALSAFFGRCADPNKEQLALLRRWFWSTSFSGGFGTGNPSRVRRLVEEFRDDLPGRARPESLENIDLNQPALPTPARFDLRSARVRVLLCVLFRRGLRRPDGEEFGAAEAARMLLERGPEAMRVLCATVSDRALRQTPANRLLDVGPPGVAGQAKNWLLELPADRREAVLESHAIAPDSFELLVKNRNDEFLRARMRHIAQIERDFMVEVDVTPPVDMGTAPSPLDADDDAPLSMEAEYRQLSLLEDS